MGYAMMIAQQSFEPALMLAWLGWIGVVGFAVNAAMQRLQRWVARRMGVRAMNARAIAGQLARLGRGARRR